MTVSYLEISAKEYQKYLSFFLSDSNYFIHFEMRYLVDNNNRIQNMQKTWEEFMRPTNQIVDRENSSPYVVYYQTEPREYRRKQR